MGEVLLFLISEWPQWLEKQARGDGPVPRRGHRSSGRERRLHPAHSSHVPAAREGRPVNVRSTRNPTQARARELQPPGRGGLGSPMPLIAARQSGPLAAATLLAGARMWVARGQGPPRTRPAHRSRGPLGDRDERRRSGDRPMESVGDLTPGKRPRAHGGARCSATGRFMALARDLARNFMVLTPIVVEPRRRVIKLSYQEVTGMPRVKVGRRPFIDRKRKAKKPRRSYPQGVGMITAKACKAQDVLSGSGDSETPVDRTPLPGVEVKLDGPEPCTMRTGVDGSAVVQAPLGNYTVSCTGPTARSSSPTHRTASSPHQERKLSCPSISTPGPPSPTRHPQLPDSPSGARS